MAAENRFCINCGTPLVIQDGKYRCPNCGTEYAVDWGREDVARAEVETAQARNQAQLDRDLTISQKRAQIAQQQQYNAQQRKKQREMQGIENFLIKAGIAVASFILIAFSYRACTMLVAKNSGSISNAILGEDADKKNGQAEETKITKIDEKALLNDETFLKEAYAAEVYAIRYLTDREIVQEGTDAKYTFTGQFECEEGYLLSISDGRSELFQIFSLEYSSEENSETLTVYVPVYLAMSGVRADGKVACDNDAKLYKGADGLHGFIDKSIILDKYLESWETVEDTVSFEIPEKIRSEVAGA
ncbi:MAG: hypothetical protein J5750_08095 [Clostridiales bacterium]|nr:hypothetical protein [Clostridiales bacterium]